MTGTIDGQELLLYEKIFCADRLDTARTEQTRERSEGMDKEEQQ